MVKTGSEVTPCEQVINTGLTNVRKVHVAQSGAKDQKGRKGPKNTEKNHVLCHTDTIRGISLDLMDPQESFTYQNLQSLARKTIR